MSIRRFWTSRASVLVLGTLLAACGADKTTADTESDASFEQDIQIIADAGDDAAGDALEEDVAPDSVEEDAVQVEDVVEVDVTPDVEEDTGPECGNGVLELGEECDDGGLNSDNLPDRCRTDCTAPLCGDGVIDADEDCDDGDGNSDEEPGACPTDCQMPLCGDGVLDSTEECDDGVDNDNESPDACRTNCREAYCGDGVVDSDEACEVGVLGATTCIDFGFRSGVLACTDCGFDDFDCSDVAVCGDGLFADDVEACDDGNLDDGDGCSSACAVCEDDASEPNQSFEEMTPIPYGTDALGLVAQSGNSDFYTVRVSTGCRLEMQIVFEHAVGDIDAIVYNIRREEVFRAESDSDNERICSSSTDEACIPTEGGGFASTPYFIEVIVDGANACVPYSITQTTICG